MDATLAARWAPTIITLVSLSAGLGLMWGILKTSVSHLTSQVDRLEANVDRNEVMVRDLQEEVRVRFAESEARGRVPKRGRK